MALREILSRLGIEVDTKKLDQADGSINKAKEGLVALAGAYAGFKAVGSVVSMTTEMANQADQLQKTANAFGVSARALAEWRYAAEQAGVEASVLDDAVKTFSSKAYDALTKGSKDSRALLKKVGISMRDLKNLSPEEVFERAIIGFSEMKNGAQKTAMGLELFGGSAEKLFDMFNQGAAGLNAIGVEFNELYGSNFEEYIKRSQKLAADLGKMDAAFTAVKQTIAHALMPVLDVMANGLIRAASWFNQLARKTKIVEVGLIVLAAVASAVAIVIAVSFAPVILTILAIAAAIATVILIVEDLYVLFTGGNSAIGALIEKAFGTGAARKFVSVMRAVGRAVKNFFLGLTGQDGSDKLHAIGNAFLEFGKFVLGVFEWIGERASDIWDVIGDDVKNIVNLFITMWKGAWTGIKFIFEKAYDAVRFIAKKIEMIVGGVKDILDAADRFFNPAKVDVKAAQKLEQTLSTRIRAGEDSGIPIRRSAREAPRVTNITNNVNMTAPNPEAAGAMVNRELRKNQDRQHRAAYEGLDRVPAR